MTKNACDTNLFIDWLRLKSSFFFFKGLSPYQKRGCNSILCHMISSALKSAWLRQKRHLNTIDWLSGMCLQNKQKKKKKYNFHFGWINLFKDNLDFKMTMTWFLIVLYWRINNFWWHLSAKWFCVTYMEIETDNR